MDSSNSEKSVGIKDIESHGCPLTSPSVRPTDLCGLGD